MVATTVAFDLPLDRLRSMGMEFPETARQG